MLFCCEALAMFYGLQDIGMGEDNEDNFFSTFLGELYTFSARL